jgi:hypothetical protein
MVIAFADRDIARHRLDGKTTHAHEGAIHAVDDFFASHALIIPVERT